MIIEPLSQTDPATRAAIIDFLAPHEPHALFILGNLKSNLPAHLYLASDTQEWLGLAAYYPMFKSLVPFSTKAEVSRRLARHVAGLHPHIEYLNGIDYVAEPAYEELLSLGYRPENDPHQVFMELEGLPPQQRHEECCRLFRPEDTEQVVRLLRHLRQADPDAAITEAELERVRLNPQRWVLVMDGKVVSTAATSGLGIKACQIIGVATHAAYRNQGLARAVCAFLIRALAAQGAGRSVLFTNVDNNAARRCYQDLGFRITGKYYVARLSRAETTA